MLLLTVPLVIGLVIGAALGRWWVLLAIPPVALVISKEGELEGNLNILVAAVVSATFAVGVALGIAFRRRSTRTSDR